MKLNRRISSHKCDAKRGFNCCKCCDFNFDNIEVTILEECDKDVMKDREKYYYNTIDCVNVQSPIRTEEELKEWKRNNYSKANERRREKVTCECGCVVNRASLSRHRKRKLHEINMLNLNALKV